MRQGAASALGTRSHIPNRAIAIDNRFMCNPAEIQTTGCAHLAAAARDDVRYWHLADIPSCAAHVRFGG